MHTELIQRIFDHIENGDVDKAVRASLRLSRQISDHFNTALFLQELYDDQHEIARILSDDTSHLKVEAQTFILKQSFDRWLASRTVPFSIPGHDEDAEKSEVFIISAGELPQEIRRLEQTIADKRVPSNMGEYDTAAFTDRYDLVKTQMRLTIRALNKVKSRILNRCLNFVIGVERQHAAQQKTVSFLQSAQNEVQNYFKSRSDEVYEKLQKANQLVDSDSSEDMSLLLTQVRRAIKASADYFFPPETKPRICSDGNKRTLGDDQYLNRLHEFVHATFPRSASSDLLRAELDYLLAFARRLNNISSKGVHAKVTANEAKQGFLGLYLFLFNVCQRLDRADT
jgi:hypothetical protein